MPLKENQQIWIQGREGMARQEVELLTPGMVSSHFY